MSSSSLRRAQPPPSLRPLLSSFPTPPTHIPASPAVSTPTSSWGICIPAHLTPRSPSGSIDLTVPTVNPPPSGPPLSPLPPLPEGPSPVTQEEQIAFITMRRASYASTSSRLSAASRRSSNSNSISENEGSGSGNSSAISPAVSAVLLGATAVAAAAADDTTEHGHAAEDDRAPTPSPRASTSTVLSLPQPPVLTRTFSPLPLHSGGDEDSILLEQLDFTEDEEPERADEHAPRGRASSNASLQVHKEEVRDGASSPDISALIERTPRTRSRSNTSASGSRSNPSRRSRSSHSSGPSIGSASTALKRLKSTPALGSGSVVGFGFYPATRPAAPPFPAQFARAAPEPVEDEEWDEGDHWDEIWEEGDAAEERGEGSDEDVIDLRTPLPHLMLRAGLLSPHSKLLPRPSASPSPEPPALPTRPHTLPAKKSKPVRDERDTEKRRQRHKDGKLLRGGIGLTTGLGWSDSEDEDAPSALTDRLSKLAPTLSRKTSAASSLASSPFARSPSRSTTFSTSTATSKSALSRSTSGSNISLSSVSTHDREQSTSTLPYLSPIESLNEEQDHAQELDMPVPEYPYSFPPPSPTDAGHSLQGHEPTTSTTSTSLLGHELTPPPHVTGTPVWRPPRSPLFDDVDPFARQYRPPANNVGGRETDRSPTPTNSASTTSLPMPGTPEEGRGALGYRGKAAGAGAGAVRKASMPALQHGKREDDFDVGGMPPPRALRRPVSKALPPLPPVDRVPSFSATPPTPQPAQRTSGIPKTASMSSLRSVASAQSQPTLPTSFSQSMRLRERATSSASVQSLRSMRSSSSSVSSRPSLPTPGSKSAGPVGMVAQQSRARTSSTSSTASMRPLKSAIKPPSGSVAQGQAQGTYRSYGDAVQAANVGMYARSGMALPRPRYPSHVAGGQTGIAI